MKRSVRIFKQARREAWVAGFWFSVATAAGAWAAAAMVYGKGPGGAFLALVTVAALRLFSGRLREWWRMRKIAIAEARLWECRTVEQVRREAWEQTPDAKVLRVTLAVAVGVPAIAAAVHLFWKFSCN